MKDDKPTLTRRRVLGGVATIGAAGALGGATWAQMKDTEDRQFIVRAGGLDLVLEEADNPVTISPFSGPYADVWAEDEVSLQFASYVNEGSVPGDWLGYKILNIDGSENGLMEPENDDYGPVDSTPNVGELAQYINVEIGYYYPNGEGPAVNPVFSGDLKDLEGTTVYSELPTAMAQGVEVRHMIDITLDDANLSTAMSDKVSFDLLFLLWDEKPAGAP